VTIPRTRLLAALIGIAALIAALPAAAQGARPPDRPWQSWLVRIEHMHRRDIQPDDAKRLEALAESIESAATPREKAAAERALEDARTAAAAHAGFIIYGWSMHADALGRSVSDSSAMSGFFVPGGPDAERLFGGMNPGDCIAIDRQGAEELFTFEGRKWIRALRGVAAANNTKLKTQAFSLPPDRPMSPAQQAIRVTFRAGQTVPHNDNLWHKSTVRVEAEREATTRPELTVYLATRVIGPRGEVFGPIIESFDVQRLSRDQSFDVTRSFDIITLNGFQIDPEQTKVELIGAQ